VEKAKGGKLLRGVSLEKVCKRVKRGREGGGKDEMGCRGTG